MIKIKHYDVVGWGHAIRGMRNPMNSWEKSDSKICGDMDDCIGCRFFDSDGRCTLPTCDTPIIGPNDLELMKKLTYAGPVHGKFMRMIAVYLDITAPLYWWKEYDTYKVGTVANSCSTMHKIHAKEFTLDDFSHDHLEGLYLVTLENTITMLNDARATYNAATDPEVKKKHWHYMIELLPSSYMQRRTVMLNYEVLTNIYESRKDHKLDEWRALCAWIESLPYSELITGER